MDLIGSLDETFKLHAGKPSFPSQSGQLYSKDPASSSLPQPSSSYGPKCVPVMLDLGEPRQARDP